MMALSFIGGASGGPGGSGSVIAGHGEPPSGSGLEVLDGVNDPYRWAPYPPLGGWISPAFLVTVAEDATLNLSGATPPAGSADVAVFLTSAASFSDINDPAHALMEIGSNGPFASINLGDSDVASALGAGSGIAFLVQYETDYAGPTAVPDASLDVADYLGAGFTLGEVYQWPDESLGVDGQWYIDLDTRDLYGPREGGSWTKFATLPAPE